ncbi:hypothetical protein T265_14705, partial [Opisthorchis viverrini]
MITVWKIRYVGIILLCSRILNVNSIRCRSCLPCRPENKERFIIKPDIIESDCKVCITAKSKYSGYEVEGRACMHSCPTVNANRIAKPGMTNNVRCCYKDLCNNRSVRHCLSLYLLTICVLLNTTYLVAETCIPFRFQKQMSYFILVALFDKRDFS